jgi:hypothetical protein
MMVQGRVGCDLGDLLEWLSGIEVIKTIVWQGRNINNGFDQELSGDLPQLVSGTGKWFECSFQGQESLYIRSTFVRLRAALLTSPRRLASLLQRADCK